MRYVTLIPDESRPIRTFQDIIDGVNKAHTLYLQGNFEEAYEIIVDAVKTFDMLAYIHFQGDGFGKNEYKNIYMLAGDICAELGKYKEALTFYQKHQFFLLQINHDFKNADKVTLFQFRNTKSYTLHNLANNEITLVDPRIQNDIVDSPIFAWLDYACGKKNKYRRNHKPYKDSFKFLRATSFCMDTESTKAIENTLMWAHYANCHKGICVQYELDSIDFSSNNTEHASVMRLMRISYTNPDNPSDVLDFSNGSSQLNIRQGLACKSNEWHYENEVRMIGYIPTDKYQRYIQVALDTPNPIKAIYFGVRCSTQRKKIVMQIFKQRPNVEFYQMEINPLNIHRLLYHRIK